MQNIPSNALTWFEELANNIYYIEKNNIRFTGAEHEWNKLLTKNFETKADEQIILLSTEWGQGCYYNSLCPEDINGECGHAITGCVATSMAMIMKYWNYPETGFGSNTYQSNNYGQLSVDFANTQYQWATMPNYIYEENNAIATLMYHCGVAVNMNYSAYASSASISPQSFTNHFRYSKNAKTIYKVDFSQAEWIDILKNEIDNLRPVEYVGFSDIMQEGHAWVCDGYDENDLLHFNWGWNSLGGFYDASTNIFPSSNFAIIEIMPPANCDIALKEILSPVSQTFTESSFIKVKLANYSSEILENIPISYQINDEAIHTEVIAGPINPNEEIEFSFDQDYDFSVNYGETYHLKVFSALACDDYHNNDTLTCTISNLACGEMPFFMGFSVNENREGWFIEDVNQDGTTWRMTPLIEGYLQHVAYYPGNSNIADDWLFTKCIAIDPNKMYKLSYDYTSTGMYWYQNLEIYLGSSPESSSMSVLLDSILHFNNGNFLTKHIYFSGQDFEHSYIGFRAFSEAGMSSLAIDNINIQELNQPDIAVVELVSPIEQCDLGLEAIQVKLRNLSSFEISNFEISYSINSQDVITETISDVIASGEYFTFQFSENFDFSQAGEYEIKLFSSVENDADTSNDTLIVIINNYFSAQLPYILEFNSVEDLEFCVIENANNDNRYWKFYQYGGHNNNGCLLYEYNDFKAADDWFFTRCFWLEPSFEYNLSFFHKIEDAQWPESLEVKFGKLANSGFMSNSLLDFPNLLNVSWQKAEVDFYVPEQGFYYIGFHCYSEAQMFNLYLDDISLSSDYSNISNFHKNGYSVFPNPSSGLVNIKTENLELYNITILDVNSRIIEEFSNNIGDISFELNNIPSGIYFLKIKTKDLILTKKLVVK